VIPAGSIMQYHFSGTTGTVFNFCMSFSYLQF
jgi:hypothetical protein